MKSILCFGDSLTWGSDPVTGGRHSFEARWPNVMAARLSGLVRVVEEGMNGRTTVFDDPTVNENRNGAALLPSLLMSHQPLDLVILALGTNDLKFAQRCRAFDAMLGIKRLVGIIRRFDYKPGFPMPKVLIAAPPHVERTANPQFIELFGHAIDESHLFAKHYAALGAELGTGFFDAAPHAKADPFDGVHLDRANTIAIGEAIAPLVKAMLFEA
jgi:lysophospholipase L1-like esterase